MRVLHVIPSLSRMHGGPSHAIDLMTNTLGGLGVEVEIATTDDDGPRRRVSKAVATSEVELRAAGNRPLRRFFRKWTDFYKISPGLAVWLLRNVRNYDVVHIHALFSFSSTSAAWIARWKGTPYVVRPLGVLNEYGRTQRRPLLKRLSIRFIERPILRAAAAVHFTADAERKEAMETGIPFRSVVIPLGVAPVPQGDGSRLLGLFPGLSDGIRLLFLSRLDPKKNLEGLIEALALLRSNGRAVSLIVAGSGDAAYVHSLKEWAQAQGVAEHITWLGHVESSDKADAFSAADIFVLPSYSENFGIVVAEALSAGLPCVVGRGVALAESVARAGAGIVVGNDAISIAAGIAAFVEDIGARKLAGEKARELVNREYSVEKMGSQLCTLYADIVDHDISIVKYKP